MRADVVCREKLALKIVDRDVAAADRDADHVALGQIAARGSPDPPGLVAHALSLCPNAPLATQSKFAWPCKSPGNSRPHREVGAYRLLPPSVLLTLQPSSLQAKF